MSQISVEESTAACGAAARSARIIAVDEATGKLAVVRKTRTEDGSDYVEFYNILSGWLATPEMVVCPENGSIEHALFVGSQLMTSHANGSVCIVDPHSFASVKRVQVAATTIWSACVHRSPAAKSKTADDDDESTHFVVALATHSSVFFFDVTTRIVLYSVPLGIDNRVFSVSSNSELVAVGGIDGVTLIRNKTVQNTLKLDRKNKRDPTIAWAVQFWKSDILACGDSRGVVTIWNPASGALIQSLACMQSHVLAMCINGGLLNVAGVDPRITTIKQIGSGEYQVVKRRNGPLRDVRSLASYNDKVYASGEDFDVFVGEDGCTPLTMQWQRSVRMAGEIQCVAGESWVDVWWKQHGEDEPDAFDVVPQHFQPIHFARVFAPKKRVLTAWAISKCGTRLAMSTAQGTTIYELDVDGKRVRDVSVAGPPATALHVTAEALFLCTGDFEIFAVPLTGSAATPRQFLDQSGCGVGTQLSVSPCSMYATVITSRSQVFVVSFEQGESRQVRVDLPIDAVCTSTAAFVLATHEAFVDNCDDKKVLFEVSLANGTVKHAATNKALHLTTSYKTPLPVSMSAFDDHRILVSSPDARWSIIDTQKGCVLKMPASKHRPTSKQLPTTKVVALRRLPTLATTQKEATKEKPSPMKGRIRRATNSISSDSGVDSASQSMSGEIRVVVIRVNPDEQPKTDPFRLKRFGMQ